MNIQFTREQEMLRTQAEKFAEKYVMPIAAEIDRKHEYPVEVVKKLFEYGYMAIGFDKEYGGTGQDRVAQTIVTEELARKCASTAAIYSIHQAGVFGLANFGSKEQKEKYLKACLHEGMIAAFALTEPSAGSDAANVQTVAVKDGEDYILNGTKCFITGAGRAGLYTVLAMTEPENKTRGMTAFLVEANTPGVTIGKIEDKMGIRASQTGELILENVKISASNILGGYNKGFKIALGGIDGARISVVGGQALGIAREAFDLAVQYSKERVQFGASIGNNQGIQWYLAEMKTRIEAASLMTYHAAQLHNTGKRISTEAAMVKYYASETARFVTNLALQIHGGYGFMTDYALERLYRDAKITEIYEGTNEICKMVIGRSITG